MSVSRGLPRIARRHLTGQEYEDGATRPLQALAPHIRHGFQGCDVLFSPLGACE